MGWKIVAVGVLALACGGDMGHPEIVTATITPTTTSPAGVVSMSVETKDFSLVSHQGEEGEHEVHGDTVNIGHYHVYLDDLMTNPLAMPMHQTFDVTIPATTDVGQHELIVRLHAGSHIIIEPQVIYRVPIEVTVE